jgi:hypothetical protein
MKTSELYVEWKIPASYWKSIQTCQPDLAHHYTDLAMSISYNCLEAELNLSILNVIASSHIWNNQHNICTLVKVLKDQNKYDA